MTLRYRASRRSLVTELRKLRQELTALRADIDANDRRVSRLLALTAMAGLDVSPAEAPQPVPPALRLVSGGVA